MSESSGMTSKTVIVDLIDRWRAARPPRPLRRRPA
jgi:hypothetical protein